MISAQVPVSPTARTRERIIAAAQELIARKGAAACTMRAVAGRAKITPGAIYRHFSSRQQLLAHAVNRALERLEVQLMESIISLPVGSVARIAALGQAYIEFAQRHEQEFRVLFLPHPGVRRRLGEISAKAGYPLVRRCVLEAMNAGQLRPAAPDLVALYLWVRVHGIVTLFMACDVTDEIALDQPLDPLTFFERTRQLLLHGLSDRPLGDPEALQTEAPP